MSREPNAQLISLMTEASVSNKGLAKRMRDLAQRRGIDLGTTHVSVQRWRDGSGIRPPAARIMADALSAKMGRRITQEDLGLLDNPDPPASQPITYLSALPETLSALGGLTEEQRETASNNQLITPDTDFSTAVLSWMVARPDGVMADRPSTQRVGMRDVNAIQTATEMFMRLDFLYGGGHGHKALGHYFRHEVLPLLNASYSEKVGQSLFRVAAETAEVLGWMAYDIGNHDLANRYLLHGLRLTQVTGDRMFGASILANLSHQANYLGHTSRALQLARAAVEGAHSSATPRAKAMYTIHEARALSSGGDLPGASRAMNEAEHHFERADAANDPEWLAYFDEAELIGEFSHCFRDLKRPTEALHFAEQAVSKTNPQYARTLGFCRMVLADSHLLNGDLDSAIHTATKAVKEGESLQSIRFLRYVTDFQEKTSVHAKTPIVTRFNDQISEALANLKD
ncbi:sporulation protein [Streptomyces sp. BH-SS-21]|uniref:Sporulation protein n=1 Tax=Streptomyces liliiviolaceus TaxID=2823109 RepID=A0A940XW02_9ACTN|nr:sporulation protein [Streptomyces liliiviolaceus]MBQ0848001.1 sporulation protein [Streptomyces liliiviolaceus]